MGVRAEKDASCGESMVSASIIKIFIMAAAYEDVDAGKFSEEALSDDIYEMITYSDNEATNRLVTALGQGDPGAGMARVNAYARSVGCPNTRMERLMLVENGKQNYVSILSILKEQRWNDYIPKGPPEGTAIAHKSGDLIGIVQGDVGIVYDGKGPYIVCIIWPAAGTTPIYSTMAFCSTARQTVSLSVRLISFMTGSAREYTCRLALILSAMAQKRRDSR